MNTRKPTRRIIETSEITPERTATKILSEDSWVWNVACECGCGRRISVAKIEYVPVDPMNPHGEVRARRYTRPGQRRSLICGPFPKEA